MTDADTASMNDKSNVEGEKDYEGDYDFEAFDSDEYDSGRYTPYIDEYDDDFDEEGLF